jgi:hypothetical protein
MTVDSFLKAADDIVDALLGTVVMTVADQTFPVVYNDGAVSAEGVIGGLEIDIQATAVAQASHVTNPRSLLHKRCTVDGIAYRIAQVRSGSVAVHFVLADPGDSR